jgi:4-hydroxyphenylacetate 3-monooxygenase
MIERIESAGTGARTGDDFIRRLSERPPNLWYGGQHVTNPVNFQPMRGGIQTLAALYDYQWEFGDLMLEDLEGKKTARSLTITKNKSELSRLGQCLIKGAQFSNGMLGREPAYLNRSIAAFAGCAAFFDTGGMPFSANVRDYHKFVQHNDLCLTHTILNPRLNRAMGPAFQADPGIAAHVTRETDSGIYVSGARMVATLPFADEIAVFPAKLMDASLASEKYAFAFALPTDSAGLKFLCRESIDYGKGKRNHPLGARYEEMDAVALFEDVFVPWERVFCYRDIGVCNEFYDVTGATAHIAFQVVCKNIVKIEFFLGLIGAIIESAGLASFQHVHQKVAEVWSGLQIMKALKVAAESAARPNDYGMLVPDWPPLEAARFTFPDLHARMVEIVQQLGASGLVALPTSDDLEGPLRVQIDKYFSGIGLSAAERIGLYRLAWDASVSAFAGRQVLYERFFFGDPVNMASRIFRSNPCSELRRRVLDFVRGEDV